MPDTPERFAEWDLSENFGIDDVEALDALLQAMVQVR
eukprot:COSAG05_NODE_1286_length_5278_cov_4.428461_6_plen_37_part_00